MHSINIHEAKTHLSRLIDQVAAGEEVVIARAGKPVARLVPLSEVSQQPRKLGLGKGRFSVPDSFDGMSGIKIQQMFEQGK